ncbi:MAG: hypothetical protein HQL24_02685 [Candidatus Omnitrophica bacterium]|nr:hypothetical protein [Candidatus Omnitrophota bacterium]
MKTFFMKLFLVVAASLCMFEGLVFLAVGLGRLSPDKLVTLYNNLLQTPSALKTMQGAGAFFIALGFILLVLSARTKHDPKVITVEQDGKVLNIPQKTVMDFIKQIGTQNPYVSYFHVNFYNKPKEGFIISIAIDLHGVPSVQQELSRIEQTLSSELENVFGWKNFKFNFSVQGVSVNPKKKYFSSPEESKEPEAVVPAEEKSENPATEQQPPVETPTEETNPADLTVKKSAIEDAASESAPAEEEQEQLFDVDDKRKPQKTSVISKMLWGK